MNQDITISVVLNTENDEILSKVANSNIAISRRKPAGIQMNAAVELIHHCFIEISNGALNAIGEQLIDVLLPYLLIKIQRPKVIHSDGILIETNITKYLDRVALKVNYPIFKERIGRELNTDFFLLIDSEWTTEELETATLYFKEEMRKLVNKEPSKIDAIIEHPLIAQTVIIKWNKEKYELEYAGPIPEEVLQERKITA